MEKISYEEYQKAQCIIKKFENQDYVQVTVQIKADIELTLYVDEKWSTKQIKEELKGGWDGFKLSYSPDMEIKKVKVIYRNGENVE